MTATRRPAPGDHRPTSAAARTGRDLARGAGAVAALFVSLVGVPWLLAALGGSPLPARLPSLSEITDTLARPDDGSLFLEALLLLGWAGWVAFALSVAVEVSAQLRGRSAPRLPALGASQRAAGALVAAVAVLLVSSALPPASTEASGLPGIAAGTGHRPPAPAPDHIRTGIPATSLTPVEQANVTAARATPARHPTYRVHRQDTLWAIAERCLGAGERFSEIADLNYGIAQDDGRALTSSHWIYPGWVLRLPPDARIGTRTGNARPDSAGRGDNHEYTVRPGDTLWDISATELGSATRYDEIAALNAGHPQPDGQRLRDPDHIEPGWQLQLPTTSERRAAGPDESRTTTLAPGRDASPDDRATPAATPTAAPPPTDPPAPTPRADDPRATDHADTHAASERGDQDKHDEPEGPVPAKVGLGLAGITAAALLAALARRRALQQRARPPGRRIALPDAAVQAVEARLRVADDRDTLGQLRAALLLLAAQCADARRELPVLGAVRITRTDIELHLLRQDPVPVEPFIAVTGDRWRADLSDFPTSDGDRTAGDDEVPFPYPALLTVDATDDSTLLVDLEAAGTLTAVGAPGEVEPVLNAWAVELAVAPAWDTVGVTLVGRWPPAAVDAARVRLLDSPATAARRAAVRARDVTAILDAAHVGTVREARSRGVAPDVWDPEVVLSSSHPDDDSASLSELLDACGTGVAVVTAVPTADSAPPGWTMTATGGGSFRLDPLGISVTPPRLEDRHLVAVTAALEVANDQVGVDPPAQPAVPEVTDFRADTTPGPTPDEQDMSDGNPDQKDDPRTGPPRILVLGPVEVRFTNGEDAESARRRKLTELAAFIALHPGADNHGIDDAIWPARRASPSTRNSATSRLRRWLGAGPEGDPWLPVVPDRGQYRFRPEVGCDWHDFQALTRRGLAAGGPQGLEHLAAALALVRGRPFTGVDPAWYTWAEYDTQEMISAVTDVAHILSKAKLAGGDPEGARIAAAHGLLVEPCSELLTQDAIRAATALGDSAAAKRLVEQLRARLSAIDPDATVDADTVELVRGLART